MRGVDHRPPALASVPPDVATMIYDDVVIACYGERMVLCGVCEILREWSLRLRPGDHYPDGWREPHTITGQEEGSNNGR